MKLRWVEVENFRSIDGPVRCTVEDEITVLAGKNESGKSNLLQALIAFQTGKFAKTDVPENSKMTSVIMASFGVQRDELLVIAREIFEFGTEEKFEVTLRAPEYELQLKRYSNKAEIHASGSAIVALENLQNGELTYWTEQVSDLTKQIKDDEQMQKRVKELETMKTTEGPEWLKFIGDLLASLGQLQSLNQADLESIKGNLEKYQQNVEFYSSNFNFPSLLNAKAPKFVLFNSFEDILPDEATEEAVESSVILPRFFKVAGIDPAQIFDEENSKARKTVVNHVSSQITGDFCGYYKQSEVQIKLDVDGERIQFYIHDGDLPTPFFLGQRSKGFQWFLSFYLTLKSERSDNNLVLLIDEPGLYLHARAQSEVLQVLESLARENQVIFSTHSPYLIDPERLNRVRLVMRKSVGGSTVVLNKIQSAADKDTLTPIVTAIGYSFGQGLSLGRSLNIITEGISDAYYLRAFIHLYAPHAQHEVGVIGAVGASQVPNVMSILLGWGVKCIAVFDNDREGKKYHRTVTQKLGLTDGVDALLVSPTPNESIEDLIAAEDFYTYVLHEPYPGADAETDKNSQVVGERKVVLAKEFYEFMLSEPNLTLSIETQGNILRLLSELGLSIEDVPTTQEASGL